MGGCIWKVLSWVVVECVIRMARGSVALERGFMCWLCSSTRLTRDAGKQNMIGSVEFCCGFREPRVVVTLTGCGCDERCRCDLE